VKHTDFHTKTSTDILVVKLNGFINWLIVSHLNITSWLI